MKKILSVFFISAGFFAAAEDLQELPEPPSVLSGKVSCLRTMNLGFESAGRIVYTAPAGKIYSSRITDKNGKIIRDGDILAHQELAGDQAKLHAAQAEIKSARALLKEKELSFKRDSLLSVRGAVSKKQLFTSEAAYYEAKSALDVALEKLKQAESTLEGRYIRAPFTCIIDRIISPAGTVVDVANEVLKISAIDFMQVDIPISPEWTGLFFQNSMVMVLPNDMRSPVRAWVMSNGIRSSSVICAVPNPLVDNVRDIPEKYRNCPKVRELTIAFPSMRDFGNSGEIWVPKSAVFPDGKKGFCLWRVADSKAFPMWKDLPRVFQVEKISVPPPDLFLNEGGFYLAGFRKKVNVMPGDLLLDGVTDKIRSGDTVIYAPRRRMFLDGETVAVFISFDRTKKLFRLPLDRIVMSGTSAPFIRADGRMIPVEIRSVTGKTAVITGSGLRSGMSLDEKQEKTSFR